MCLQALPCGKVCESAVKSQDVLGTCLPKSLVLAALAGSVAPWKERKFCADVAAGRLVS